MTEFEQAKLIAEKILDEPNADPDRDEAIIARQFNRLVERIEKRKPMNPLETATGWYTEEEIFTFINRKPSVFDDSRQKVPTDVRSIEFAAWMANEYRLAMAKGIQMANNANSG
jgi:hypothetical protein